MYSPDGQYIVSASKDKTIRIWNATTGAEVSILKGHMSGIRSVIYTPDGRYLVSAGADHTVRIWEAATGKEIRVLRSHTRLVTAVTCSPDGRYIISASEDKTVRIWVASIEELLGQAQAFIQVDPPLLTSQEREWFGLE